MRAAMQEDDAEVEHREQNWDLEDRICAKANLALYKDGMRGRMVVSDFVSNPARLKVVLQHGCVLLRPIR